MKKGVGRGNKGEGKYKRKRKKKKRRRRELRMGRKKENGNPFLPLFIKSDGQQECNCIVY